MKSKINTQIPDHEHPASLSLSLNSGDDIAGMIHSLGSNVTEFAIGDRVAAMHKMLAPGGAYAEYAVAPASTTFKIPSRVMFEGAFPVSLESHHPRQKGPQLAS